MPTATKTTAGRLAGRLRREAAKEAEEVFRSALGAGRRADLGDRRIAAPPPRERVAQRFGGGTKARTGEYDWFYELNPEEQDRIRRNWMTTDRSAVTPDEVERYGPAYGRMVGLDKRDRRC